MSTRARRAGSLVLAIVAVIALAAVAPARAQAAAVVVDVGINSDGSATDVHWTTDYPAQTFVVQNRGVPGTTTLEAVQVFVFETTTATIELRTTSGGVPTSTVLASTTTALYPRGGLAPIRFTPAPTVTQGEMYAIVVKPAAGKSLTLAGRCRDEYAAGQGLIYDTAAAAWVTVPAYATAKNLDSRVVCMSDFGLVTYVPDTGLMDPTKELHVTVAATPASVVVGGPRPVAFTVTVRNDAAVETPAAVEVSVAMWRYTVSGVTCNPVAPCNVVGQPDLWFISVGRIAAGASVTVVFSGTFNAVDAKPAEPEWYEAMATILKPDTAPEAAAGDVTVHDSGPGGDSFEAFGWLQFSAPNVTPPPTAKVATSEPGSGSPLPVVLLIGIAGAGALLAVRSRRVIADARPTGPTE